MAFPCHLCAASPIWRRCVSRETSQQSFHFRRGVILHVWQHVAKAILHFSSNVQRERLSFESEPNPSMAACECIGHLPK